MSYDKNLIGREVLVRKSDNNILKHSTLCTVVGYRLREGRDSEVIYIIKPNEDNFVGWQFLGENDNILVGGNKGDMFSYCVIEDIVEYNSKECETKDIIGNPEGNVNKNEDEILYLKSVIIAVNGLIERGYDSLAKELIRNAKHTLDK